MKPSREHWASKVGFIMAAAGSAIGLGSLWRFPYAAGYNGGGAFVLLYIIFTFLFGIPSALAGSGTLFPSWKIVYGKDFFDTMNYVTACWMMPLAGLFTILFVGWVRKKDVLLGKKVDFAFVT